MGGTVGLSKKSADNLSLNSGAFGTPLYFGEVGLQYAKNGIAAKALAAYIAYPDANKVNAAYANNVAKGMYGAFAEIRYDWLYNRGKTAQFITFARCELLDLNNSIPSKAIYDGTLKQTTYHCRHKLFANSKCCC